MSKKASESVLTAICTAVSIAVLLIGWHFAVKLADIPAFVLPAPVSVIEALYTGLTEGGLVAHIGYTVLATAIGTGTGAAVGLLLGGLVAEIRLLNLMVTPVVMGMQSIPKIAVAPLIISYLGYGIESKVFTVALLCFFPVFVNTVVGLQSADRDMLQLYRSFSAGRLRTLIDVKLPAAAHHIFAAFQIAAVLGFIGCVVSEFIASTAGLGFVMKSRASELDLSMMFAVIVILASLGTACTLVVRWLHQLLVFWSPPNGMRRAPFWKRPRVQRY